MAPEIVNETASETGSETGSETVDFVFRAEAGGSEQDYRRQAELMQAFEVAGPTEVGKRMIAGDLERHHDGYAYSST